jgi:hypothetical protein
VLSCITSRRVRLRVIVVCHVVMSNHGKRKFILHFMIKKWRKYDIDPD